MFQKALKRSQQFYLENSTRTKLRFWFEEYKFKIVDLLMLLGFSPDEAHFLVVKRAMPFWQSSVMRAITFTSTPVSRASVKAIPSV